MRLIYALLSVLLASSPVLAQMTADPFPAPIAATDDLITVHVAEFASIPDIDGVAARMMHLVLEPGTRRLFVNDMRGPIYSVSYDGRSVTPYLDINATHWKVGVQSMGRERGMQSFTFHPQFSQSGAPGFGKFYTWTDVVDTAPRADFAVRQRKEHARDGPARMDGQDTRCRHVRRRRPARDDAPPAALRQPQRRTSHLRSARLARRSGVRAAVRWRRRRGQRRRPAPSRAEPRLDFRKDPAHRPARVERARTESTASLADNPFVGQQGVLPEIYAYGLRNPQRFGWDPANGNMFVADIGQNVVEELSPVTPGANLGWNAWEGSFPFISREGVNLSNQRGDARVTYPVVEYAQPDPLLQTQVAITGVHVYRGSAIPQLAGRLLFGDFPSGEIFYISADNLPHGGQDPIRRVLLVQDGGAPKTLLQLIQEKNAAQGKPAATRADLRFDEGPDGQVLLLNKHDGTIRRLVASPTSR